MIIRSLRFDLKSIELIPTCYKTMNPQFVIARSRLFLSCWADVTTNYQLQNDIRSRGRSTASKWTIVNVFLAEMAVHPRRYRLLQLGT